MSEAEVRAYVIADNQHALNAGWDKALLATEFAYLATLEVDFDLTVTGFEAPEIDTILGIGASDSSDDPNDRVPFPKTIAVCQPGDVWHIEERRLICGDATNEATYAALQADEKAAMVFSDAPYNVRINGHVSGSSKHREFAMASGEMTPN